MRRKEVFKKNQQVIFSNRGNAAFGRIDKMWRRKEVNYYDVTDERGITFEGITTDTSFPVFISEQLTSKLREGKLSKL